MSIITICASVAFYQQVIEVQATLEAQGHTVLIPATAEKMKQSGDFNVSHNKTWFENAEDYDHKTALMRGHFGEIEKGNSVLVLNYEKHGVQNYIGGNVLIEMGIAFFLNKPLYILNDIPTESSFVEEIIGMNPTVLHGDLSQLNIQLDTK